MGTKSLNTNFDAADAGTSSPEFNYNNYSDIVLDPYQIPVTSTIRPQTGGIMPITPAGFEFNGVQSPTIPSGGVIQLQPTKVAPETGQFPVNISATVYDKTGVVPGVNISVGGVNYTPTDANGNFRLVNIPNTEIVTFSFIGLKTTSFPVLQLPKKIVLEDSTEHLNEVVIKNGKKPTNFWWILAVLGLAYGGYKYSVNSKKQIVKTKI